MLITKFYVSGLEKTVYRRAIEAESADDAVSKFKKLVEQELIEEADTYLDEVMCRREGEEFPEIYDGAEDEEDSSEDNEESEDEENNENYEYDEEDIDEEGEESEDGKDDESEAEESEITNNNEKPSVVQERSNQSFDQNLNQGFNQQNNPY